MEWVRPRRNVESGVFFMLLKTHRQTATWDQNLEFLTFYGVYGAGLRFWVGVFFLLLHGPVLERWGVFFLSFFFATVGPWPCLFIPGVPSTARIYSYFLIAKVPSLSGQSGPDGLVKVTCV